MTHAGDAGLTPPTVGEYAGLTGDCEATAGESGLESGLYAGDVGVYTGVYMGEVGVYVGDVQ